MGSAGRVRAAAPSSHWQVNEVFCPIHLRAAAAGDMIEFGKLQGAIEAAVVGNAVRQAGEMPAETHGLLHPRQPLAGIGCHAVAIPMIIPDDYRLRGVMHIAGG